MPLKVSGKALLTVEAVVDIALQSDGSRTPAKDIAKRQGVDTRYLENIMQALRRKKIINSRRGRGGGYQLERPADEITVGDVMRVVASTNIPRRPAPLKSELGAQVISAYWNQTLEQFYGTLDATTIADLCKHARDIGLEPATPPAPSRPRSNSGGRGRPARTRSVNRSGATARESRQNQEQDTQQ